MGSAMLANWHSAEIFWAPGVHSPNDMVEKWPEEGLVREPSDQVLGVSGGSPSTGVILGQKSMLGTCSS